SPRRSVRLASSESPPNFNPPSKTALPHSSPVSNLVFHDEDLSLNELLDSFPGRRTQILEMINLIGPVDSPLFPLFVYGGASTGKTSTVLQIFKHLKRPFIYVSLITSYSPRLLFESILNQLSSHTRGGSENYRGKRCERPSDFVNLLREALSDLVSTLKGNNLEKNGSNKEVASVVNGRMVYLIFDRFEVARDWDKGSSTVPLLFNLYDSLKMPEVGLIFLSRASLETFDMDTGYAEPFSVHFPDYDEADLRSIFMRSQSGSKLYSAFLDLVLRPFCRITRRVDELSLVFSPLFNKYCEPLGDLGTNLGEEIKRSLFKHIQPHMTLFMQTAFISSSSPSSFEKTSPDNKKKIPMTYGNSESSGEVDFHMSISARYLLISAFLASRNPATLDASLFDSTGGLDNHKRKRKASEKSLEHKESKEQEFLMKGPGTFPLERLLAIYQCITSVLENDESEDNDESGAELMTGILFQLSSLCSANFVTKGSSCPLEGSARYRCTISEDMALKV
ncbi:hypothetical protein M569_17179, partial [Genlisea aurea]